MMNFSDETVSKVATSIRNGFMDGNDGETVAQAALSSLTLADLMQVGEVRELVHRAENVNIAIGMGWDLEGVVDLLQKALTPFTEPKQ